MRDDQRTNNRLDIPPRKIVGFESLGRDVFEARLNGHDFRVDDRCRIDLSQRHEQELKRTNPGASHECPQPQLEIGCKDRNQHNDK